MAVRFRALSRLDICSRELEVRKSTLVTPGMRRVTLGGPQLGEFTTPDGHPQPAFRSEGFDDEIRIVLTAPGETEPVLPIQLKDTIAPPNGKKVFSRPYTVRRWEPKEQILEVDFVRHEAGVASEWAEQATVGQRVHTFGPFESAVIPAGLRTLVVVGDETALPAISRLLEEFVEDFSAVAFIELNHPSHAQHLQMPPHCTVNWIPKSNSGGMSPQLLSQLQERAWDLTDLTLWIAGESSFVKAVRRWAIGDLGMSPECIDFKGYWKL